MATPGDNTVPASAAEDELIAGALGILDGTLTDVNVVTWVRIGDGSLCHSRHNDTVTVAVVNTCNRT